MFHSQSLVFSLLLISHLVFGNLIPRAASDKGCATEISQEDRDKAEAHFQANKVAVGPVINTAAATQIDIYFNIFHKDNTAEGGFVSQSQVNTQMANLNDDFSESGISFVLKELRYHQNTTIFEEAAPANELYAEMVRTKRQGGVKDLNVFTLGFRSIEGDGYHGYSSFPWDYAENPLRDAIALLYQSLPGGTLEDKNTGRIMTHEVGHWSGLYHTFQGYPVGCDLQNDQVDDTPAMWEPTIGCPIGRDSCPDVDGLDPIHNYMDYSSDACMTEFTPGQITRLREQLATYRGINL